MIDFDALVLGPCMDTFGVPAVYSPRIGPSLSIVGVFDHYHVEQMLDPVQGVPVSIQKPIIGVRAALFPTAPAQGDTLVVQGMKFLVTDTKPDGHGHIILSLKIAR